jgi:hypothetical protein
LDVHTISSTMIGHNEYGHAVFDTVRSPLGELLYGLKNRGDQAAIPEIVDTAGAFVKRLGLTLMRSCQCRHPILRVNAEILKGRVFRQCHRDQRQTSAPHR